MINVIKSEIRIIGFDDSPFTFKDEETMLIGVICRGGMWVDGVIATKIRTDNLNVTERIVDALNKSRHLKQLRIIMLDGVTFGGFNIVDVKRLYEKTRLPVIVVIRSKPNMISIKKALKKFKDFKDRWNLILNAGTIKKVEIKNARLKRRGYIYYQNVGINEEKTERILRMTSIHSLTPEPIRLAHIIAHGLRLDLNNLNTIQ